MIFRFFPPHTFPSGGTWKLAEELTCLWQLWVSMSEARRKEESYHGRKDLVGHFIPLLWGVFCIPSFILSATLIWKRQEKKEAIGTRVSRMRLRQIKSPRGLHLLFGQGHVCQRPTNQCDHFSSPSSVGGINAWRKGSIFCFFFLPKKGGRPIWCVKLNQVHHFQLELHEQNRMTWKIWVHFQHFWRAKQKGWKSMEGQRPMALLASSTLSQAYLGMIRLVADLSQLPLSKERLHQESRNRRLTRRSDMMNGLSITSEIQRFWSPSMMRFRDLIGHSLMTKVKMMNQWITQFLFFANAKKYGNASHWGLSRFNGNE